jgi:hypothetical protein
MIGECGAMVELRLTGATRVLGCGLPWVCTESYDTPCVPQLHLLFVNAVSCGEDPFAVEDGPATHVITLVLQRHLATQR